MKHKIKLSKPINTSLLRDLPTSTGVYFFKKNKNYIYIGKSNNVKVRILSHFENAKNIPKEKAIFENADSIEYVSVDSEFNALILEASLIQRYHPKYNIIWKDGKSYLYIKVTINDEYPKLYPVRKEFHPNSLYFGPFSSAKDVDLLLRSIRKIIPYCTQKKITSKACFYNKIGLCNPCPNTINKIADSTLKNLEKKRYLLNIKSIVNILKGNTSPILKNLYKQLKIYTKNQEYESAIKIRNTITNFDFLIHYRTFTKDGYHENSTSNYLELFDILKTYFSDLKSLNRIECYDVSNFTQKDATASMIVAQNGILDKSEYRKFKIKRSYVHSDFEMLQETVERRFNNKWTLPDLIVLDGGRPQVRMIKTILSLLHISIPIIGIAKNPDRIVIGNDHLTSIKPQIYNKGFNLIRLMRDESHRFARNYHLYLRDRKIV